MLIHPHDIMFVMFVLLHQKLEQLSLLFCKFMIYLGISIDFHSYTLSSLVIEATDYLRKTTLTQNLQNFKSIVQLISWLNNEVAFLIITFFFAFCYSTDSPFHNITWIVNHVLAFKTIVIIRKFFLFEIGEYVSIVLSKLLLFHGSPSF